MTFRYILLWWYIIRYGDRSVGNDKFSNVHNNTGLFSEFHAFAATRVAPRVVFVRTVGIYSHTIGSRTTLNTYIGVPVQHYKNTVCLQYTRIYYIMARPISDKLYEGPAINKSPRCDGCGGGRRRWRRLSSTSSWSAQSNSVVYKKERDGWNATSLDNFVRGIFTH